METGIRKKKWKVTVGRSKKPLYYDTQAMYLDFITNEDPHYTISKCARNHNVPKQTISSFFSNRPGLRDKWLQDREKNIESVNGKVIAHVNASRAIAKAKHIEDIKGIMDSTIKISQRYLKFLEDLPEKDVNKTFNYTLSKYPQDDGEPTELYYERVIKSMIADGLTLSLKDITELMRIIKMLSHEYSELEGFIKSKGGNTINKKVYNINVPIQYLTPDGIKFVQDRRNNPTLIPEEDVEFKVEDG